MCVSLWIEKIVDHFPKSKYEFILARLVMIYFSENLKLLQPPTYISDPVVRPE